MAGFTNIRGTDVICCLTGGINIVVAGYTWLPYQTAVIKTCDDPGIGVMAGVTFKYGRQVTGRFSCRCNAIVTSTTDLAS